MGVYSLIKLAEYKDIKAKRSFLAEWCGVGL